MVPSITGMFDMTMMKMTRGLDTTMDRIRDVAIVMIQSGIRHGVDCKLGRDDRGDDDRFWTIELLGGSLE